MFGHLKYVVLLGAIVVVCGACGQSGTDISLSSSQSRSDNPSLGQPPVAGSLGQFAGMWQVHDASLTLSPSDSSISGQVNFCGQLQVDFICTVKASLQLATSPGGNGLTERVERITVTDSQGRAVSNPYGLANQTGDLITFRIVQPGLLHASTTRGGAVLPPGYWCAPSLSYATFGEYCGG
jgi:hypothetical protein